MTALLTTFALLLGWYAVRTLVVVGGFSLWARRSWRRIIARAYLPAEVRKAMRQAAGVLVFDAAVIVLIGQLGWIRFAPSTVLTTLVTFAVTFVWYEIWFYFAHRMLHETALYRIHALHHEARVPHPFTTLTFSVAERSVIMTGMVAFNILISHVMPVAIAGLTLYGIVNHVLGVLGHSNVEVYPRGWADRPIGKVWSTVTHHALHHERERGHYGLFTCVLDNLFGTAFRDYPRLQRLAAGGASIAGEERLKVVAGVAPDRRADRGEGVLDGLGVRTAA